MATKLMWDVRRGVDASQFPRERVVVQIQFDDAPKGMEYWWLVSEQGSVDLCREDPGHDVDLLVRSSVRALTAVWMRRLTLAEAKRSGDLRVSGRRSLEQRLTAWFRGSPIARLGEQSLRDDPIPAD